MESPQDDLNLRTMEIQKFLIRNLKLTPRRQVFEEHATSKQNDELERIKAETYERDEIKSNFDWTSFNKLREFREKNPSECMSSINHQRLQRVREKDKEFLEQSCSHRCANSFGSFKTTEGKGFCESRSLSSSSDASDVHSQFLPDMRKKIPRMKTLRFAPENSLALSHQKFKY
jgi:hypothetical protein